MEALPGVWSRSLLADNVCHLELGSLKQEDLVNLLHNLNANSYPDLNRAVYELVDTTELNVRQLNLLLSTVLRHRIVSDTSSSHIIQQILARGSPTLRDIANFMDCLADHRVVDPKAIKHSKDVLLSLTAVAEETAPDDLGSKLIPGATARDCSQLLSAFVRLEAIDGETFDVLETNFINNLDRCPP